MTTFYGVALIVMGLLLLARALTDITMRSKHPIQNVPTVAPDQSDDWHLYVPGDPEGYKRARGVVTLDKPAEEIIREARGE